MSEHGAGPVWAMEYTLRRIQEGHSVHVNSPNAPPGSCRSDCPHSDHAAEAWEQVTEGTFKEKP